MEMTAVLMYGAIGGLIPDLLRIAKAKGNLAEVGGLNVLISMVVLAIIGAIAAVVADNLDAAVPTLISSITAGFTGPEVLSRLAGSAGGGGGGGSGPTPQGTGGGGAGILRWWRV